MIEALAGPVTSKAQMYELLARGRFGNTVPQWLDVNDWWADNSDHNRSTLAPQYDWWGVRSAAVSAHPACRLNVPAAEVVDYCVTHFPDGKVNISPMVDRVAVVTAWLEVWDSPTGLAVEGIEFPNTAAGWTWRSHMSDPLHRKSWTGVEALMVLKRHLNGNSYDDLREVLERYPGHVVELSALARCIGTVPHRNAVVWEVRGGY